MASPSSPSPALKGVTIAEDPEIVAPSEPVEEQHRRPHMHKAISSKKLHGRLPVSPHLAASVVTKDVVPEISLAQQQAQPASAALESKASADHSGSTANASTTSLGNTLNGSSFLEQVQVWLDEERKTRKSRVERRRARRDRNRSHTPSSESEDESLNALQNLIQKATQEARRPGQVKRRSSRKTLKGRSMIPADTKGNASDTEYASDGDALVPSCEVSLSVPEHIGMDQFKKEVLTLAHTLKCKGWRRVKLDRYAEISADRISGALTNAVYMISPPAELPTPTVSTTSVNEITKTPRAPSKLLLRIYGPQVSHLIDRETELGILRRLARQKIGPRLLGTFLNGRFEEFFASHTLTRDDIRVPETSRHIAKRLKELHEGIELEAVERRNGPIVFRNWDKWVSRARSVMATVDQLSVSKFGASGRAAPGAGDAADWEKRGFVCGTPWNVFESAVQRYRAWLYAQHGGESALHAQLVFAHNDTQYGNILRLHASGKSPLLLPSNEHRQLIVIDFEYASANHRGFEFANHFCEWMANYHDAQLPYLMRPEHFPSEEQQRNFLKAYLEHSLASSVTPRGEAPAASSYFPAAARAPPSFDLDARTPYRDEEAARAAALEKDVDTLRAEARAWRAASHAMWAAWGIVQAKLSDADTAAAAAAALEQMHLTEDGAVALSPEAAEAKREMADKRPDEPGEEEEEFDYLAYAQQRALLFWGDVLEMGIVKEEEVPELLEVVKRVGR